MDDHPALQDYRKKANPNQQLILDTFLQTLYRHRLELAHISNLPDIDWKIKKVDSLPTHFFHWDSFSNLISPLNSDYLTVSKQFDASSPDGHFFSKIGYLPWRIEAFYQRYRTSLTQYPVAPCASLSDTKPHPTSTVLREAGLLSHFIADSTVPFHGISDYDGVLAGQKGVHSYFESSLVDALENDLPERIRKRSLPLLSGKPKSEYSLKEMRTRSAKLFAPPTTSWSLAMSFYLIKQSAALAPEALALDRRFALKGPTEKDRRCWISSDATDACRRPPTTLVDSSGRRIGPKGGKTVAVWHEALIVNQLAIGAVILADFLVSGFLESPQTHLCPTSQYVLSTEFEKPLHESNP